MSGRPLAGSVMHAAGGFGAITLRDGSVHAKVQLLPFDGGAYGVFAYVDSILLLNEPQSSERLSLTQRLMINPMVRSAAAELIAAQDEAIARYTAESASDMLEPEQRCAASKKAAHQRNIRGTLGRVSEAPEQYILVASQPLQSFPCLGALDVTAQLIPRDNGDRDASRRRSSLGWAFARESPIATAIARKNCQALARPCWWHNGSSARRPRLRRAFSALPAPSPMLLLLRPRKWLRVASPLGTCTSTSRPLLNGVYRLSGSASRTAPS